MPKPTEVYILSTIKGYLNGALDSCSFDIDGLCAAACMDVRDYAYFGDEGLSIAVIGDSVRITDPNGCEYTYYIHTFKVVE